MGENGCPVECERVNSSKALGGILLKKIPDNQNFVLYLCIFFQGPVIFFVRLASPNVNMGPYGKTTRAPLSWWVLQEAVTGSPSDLLPKPEALQLSSDHIHLGVA